MHQLEIKFKFSKIKVNVLLMYGPAGENDGEREKF